MTILETLQNDIKAAMKSKDFEKLLTLRTLLSEIKNVAINNRKTIENSDCYDVLTKGIKTRQDAIEMYRKAGRQDLADKEILQIEIYRKYLPTQLTIDEISKIVDENWVWGSTIGSLMKTIIPIVKGKADMSVVSKIVKSKLENNVNITAYQNLNTCEAGSVVTGVVLNF